MWSIRFGETLCRLLDNTSQTKMILEREIKDAKTSKAWEKRAGGRGRGWQK